MGITWYNKGTVRHKSVDNSVSVSSYGIYFLASDTEAYKLYDYKYVVVGTDEDKNIYVKFADEFDGDSCVYTAIRKEGKTSISRSVFIGCTKFMADNYTFDNHRVKRTLLRITDKSAVRDKELLFKVVIQEGDKK